MTVSRKHMIFLILIINFELFRVPTESVYIIKSNGQHSKRASDEIVDITDDDDGGNDEEDDEEER